MLNHKRRVRSQTAALLTLFLAALLAPITAAVAEELTPTDTVAAGKAIAFDRQAGNCLACHHIAGGTLAGNTAPPLVAMRARFPERGALVEQIVDARIRNPQTLMPPFGAHGILSAEQIEQVVDFLYTL